jgi:hypothetical protein
MGRAWVADDGCIKKDTRVGGWAVANNVELAYTPTNASLTLIASGSSVPWPCG